MSEHDPIECLHSYLDGIIFQAVVAAIKRNGRHYGGIEYVYKSRIWDELPQDIRRKLGPRTWPDLARQSLMRLYRDRLIDDVSKAVNAEGAVALTNPLEALAAVHGG
jgi:hypothetical protein